MATVYKKINVDSVKGKQIPQATDSQKTQVNTIIGTFVNLFKTKHLS